MKPLDQATEASYFRYLQQLFSVVMILDRKLRIVFASDTLLRYLPELADEPVFDQVFELRRPREIKTYDDFVERADGLFLAEARSGKFAVRGQLLHGTEDGRDYLVYCGSPWLNWMQTHRPEVTLTLNDFSHQDVQLDLLFHMVTERSMVADLERLNRELQRAKEQLEEAQASSKKFFAQMSHEMRTPLNGVLSSLTLLQKQPLDQRSTDLLSLADKSSRATLQVINYVLDIAKLESADFSGGEQDFDLSDLLDSVVDVIRSRAMEKGLEIRVEYNASVPGAFRGEAGMLRQVLLNLCINAIKFTEQGSVAVKIDAARTEGMTVRIEVSDTGIGIDDAFHSRIFQPFATADSTGVLGEGSGLGLDIARRNVEAMGGLIGVISDQGQGARFWLELPLAVVEGQPEAAEAAAGPEAARFRGRVLLVDDNETNLHLMTMILESMGITVTAAGSGGQAVFLAEGGDFDLVLMDISMPDIDGYEATRRIRLRHDAQQLPVVALSAYSVDAEKAQSIACGMNDYLVKPVEHGRLTAVLNEYLASVPVGEPDSGPALLDEHPVVDLAVLRHLETQIGAKNLATVIGKFREEAQRRWQAIVNSGSSEELARETHTLASTCRSFGLPDIADVFNAIELDAKAGGLAADQKDLAETGERLFREIGQLVEVVSVLIGGAD